MSSRRIVENSRDPRTIRKLDAGVVIRHDHTLELKGGGVVVDKNPGGGHSFIEGGR